MDDGPAHKETTRALWFPAAGRAEIRTEPMPRVGVDDVRVRTHYSGISRGTESLVFHGEVPPGEYRRMRAPHQVGVFPFPVKYGYAATGTVTAGPRGLVGREVFALHPHQCDFVLPIDAVVPLPPGVPARRGVLAANMETALNALWDGAALPGSRIAVVGAGTVGAMTAYLAGRLPGAEVTLVDTLPEREALAARLGVMFATPEAAPIGCDLVFHASASDAGLATAFAATGDEATVVEMSWYGDRRVAAPLGGGFHGGRQRLLATQVGRVCPVMRPRWSLRRRLEKALALLVDPRLDGLLEPDLPFDALPAALPSILRRDGTALCQVIAYPT